VAERVEGVRGGGEEEEMAEVVMEAAGKEVERVEGATVVVARMAARVAATKEAEADVVACSLAPLADTAAAAWLSTRRGMPASNRQASPQRRVWPQTARRSVRQVPLAG
jgi:hypothetical protein